MELLALLGLIILIGFIFVGGGLLGHIINLIGCVFNFLWDGCSSSIGCLFVVIFILLLFCAMIV